MHDRGNAETIALPAAATCLKAVSSSLQLAQDFLAQDERPRMDADCPADGLNQLVPTSWHQDIDVYVYAHVNSCHAV